MGYELSIQRQVNQTKISKKEWINYLKSDSEFEQIEKVSTQLEDKKILTVPTPHGGLWKTEKGQVPFTFYEKYGWISVKNPEKWVIKKMISIANNLNAVVLGEEGEKYDGINLSGQSLTSEIKSNHRKWWQFWKNSMHEISHPKAKSLDSDIENDLFIGDCFHSKNNKSNIGLILFEIFHGQNGNYYSFAPVLLDNTKKSMGKFQNGQIKLQPKLGSKIFGIPAIGIMNVNDLQKLKDLYLKIGKVKFKKPIPKSTSASNLLDYTEKSLSEFVNELDIYFSEKERKKITVLKLIK